MELNAIRVVRTGALLLFVSYFFSLSVRAEFHIDLGKYRNDESANHLAGEIIKDLPDSIKSKLSEGIQLKFTNLNKEELTGFDDQCKAKMTLARVSRFQGEEQVVEVDHVVLKEWKKEKREINCPHPNNHQYVMATIIHEIFHLYDFKVRFSKSPDYLNVAGFIAKGLIIKKRTNLNQHESRSPDRYEYKDSLENAAVNFEHFLYDPSYKCRRPNHYDIFSRKLKIAPHEEFSCESNTKITMSSQSMGGSPVVIRHLDPKRLYEVHYLFAGKGDAAMSRFGHSMFRLVMCAPGKVVGPNCLQDHGYHIVVSFRANIQDVTMDYAKGINGEYPSQLFFLTLTDVINEYTKGEFREIHSLPLKLSEKEKERFMARASELYWSYKGKYYFFTNNCATEAMNLLRVAMTENKGVQKESIVTPLGMNSYLIKSKIGDDSVFKDLKIAEKRGYYFPAVSDKLLDSMKLLGIQDKKFNDFVENNNSEARNQIYKKALEGANDRVKIAANALRIEDLIVRSLELRFTKAIGAKLFGSDPDPRLQGTKLGERIMELQSLYNELSAENYVKEGYGIPLQEEFEEIPKEKILEVTEKIKTYSADLQEIAGEFFSNEVKELKRALENRLELLTIIATEN